MFTKRAEKRTSPFVWKNVHFIGDITINWENPKVFRYLRFSRVQEMFKKHEITFVSPSQWEDPYEKRYYKVKVNDGKESVPNIACLCVTTSASENASAFWNWGKNSDEPWLRLAINLYELLNTLDSFASKHKARIYVSSAKYDYNENEIKNIHKDKNFKASTLERYYIKLMSLKRQAYRFENELRIFVVWDEDSKNFDSLKKEEKYVEDKVLKISYKKSMKQLIEKITLDPRSAEFVDAKKKFDADVIVNQSQLFHCDKCKGIDFPQKKNGAETE